MKMKVKEETYDVGVIVGRFQVHELHDAHKALIKHVCDQHRKVIIFLGVSELWNTRENPLDFEARKQMILEAFPSVTVLYVMDRNSDEVWSRKLDGQLSRVVTPAQSVVLYGGRDSFISHYSGKYSTRELEQDTWIQISGSTIRDSLSKEVIASPEFRAGVVWAAHSRYVSCYPTVDVAIFNEDESEILLGRKEHENQYRLIGGFASPTSPSYEADVRREVMEEAHIEITDPVYVASFLQDDWRYRQEQDKIKTLLFKAKHMFGAPRPDDDIAELRWFNFWDLYRNLNEVVPSHRQLIIALIKP